MEQEFVRQRIRHGANAARSLRSRAKRKGRTDEKRAFETFSEKVITGESLYAFSGNYEFVKDFKKRTDTYEPNLGLVYAASDLEHKGEHLDQELLICDTTGGGEPAAFSRYGMSVGILGSRQKCWGPRSACGSYA